MKVKADHRDDLIKAFQAQEKRKHQLFFGVALCLASTAHKACSSATATCWSTRRKVGSEGGTVSGLSD